jgi:hypothetical protein
MKKLYLHQYNPELNKKAEIEAKKLAEKVAPIYKVLNWKWSSKSLEHIPDVFEIYQTLMDLYILAIGECHSEHYQIESGGLKVEIFNKPFDEEDPKEDIIFSFNIEHHICL